LAFGSERAPALIFCPRNGAEQRNGVKSGDGTKWNRLTERSGAAERSGARNGTESQRSGMELDLHHFVVVQILWNGTKWLHGVKSANGTKWNWLTERSGADGVEWSCVTEWNEVE
jgi:hypothetical protein